MSKNTDRYSAAELQKKYSQTGYKTVTNKAMSASSFWLDEDFVTPSRREIESRGLARADVKSMDYVRLAGYQRAISNFVRIVTGRTDIPVRYSAGKDSYTDGQSVVISSKIEERQFDSTVGLALHEGSHIKLTDFDLMKGVHMKGLGSLPIIKEYFNKLNVSNKWFASADSTRLQSLVNIIEDRRIDRFVYDSAPGYQGYYQALYDYYFNSKEIDQALKAGLKDDANSWDDYMFHICNFTNPNRNLKTLPALKDIWNVINIPNIDRLKSTKDVLDVAQHVWVLIDSALTEADETSTPEMEIEKEEAPKSKPSKQEAPKESEDGDEMNEDLDTASSVTSSETSDSKEDAGSGDGNGFESEESDETEESDEKGTKYTVTEESDEESEEEGAGGGAGSGTEEEEGLSKEEKEKLLTKIGKKLVQAIKDQKDFLEGKVDKKSLSKEDALKVNAAAAADANYEGVGGDVMAEDGKKLTAGKTQCLIVRGTSEALLNSGILRGQASTMSDTLRRLERGWISRNYVAEGIALGTMLGKRLKTRDEERSLKTTRLDSGRIDKRLIAELGFDNARIFSATQFSTVKPVYIHISLDASGSMSGPKWESAMKTAVAIAKAASMTSSMDVVISLRGTTSNNPLMWVVFDSRKEKITAVKDKLLCAHSNSSTPEGLCFEAVMKEMISDAQGKDAYFINVSDGAPAYSDRSIAYSGEYAYQHTRTQVAKMKAMGIKVCSYFVSETDTEAVYAKPAFTKMYGKDSEFIDVNSLTQLSRSLNVMFERK
jgi:hypothetical protein